MSRRGRLRSPIARGWRSRSALYIDGSLNLVGVGDSPHGLRSSRSFDSQGVVPVVISGAHPTMRPALLRWSPACNRSRPASWSRKARAASNLRRSRRWRPRVLGPLNHKQIATLGGVAPFARDSGTLRAKAHDLGRAGQRAHGALLGALCGPDTIRILPGIGNTRLTTDEGRFRKASGTRPLAATVTEAARCRLIPTRSEACAHGRQVLPLGRPLRRKACLPPRSRATRPQNAKPVRI